MKRKAPDSREQACVFCRRADIAKSVVGKRYRKYGLCVHEHCLYLATGLAQRGKIREGICRFLPADIKRKVKVASKQSCCVCGERGASIDCQGKGCSRSFHLPCAVDTSCVTQFFEEYKSYCWEHRPEQTVPVTPDAETLCIVCFEQLEDRLTFGTMVCPSCRGAWFHRGCIQELATNAGRECFRCPQCNNEEKFLQEMLTLGIHVPFSIPAWEDGRYDELDDRHSRCDASHCRYRRGRQQAEESGPWELILCSSCAARGTHRRCSAVSMDTWECDECAGLGPAPREQPQACNRGSTSAEAAASSSSADAPNSASAPGSSSASASPAPESSPQAARPGPERRTGRSRLARRTRRPYSRP